MLRKAELLHEAFPVLETAKRPLARVGPLVFNEYALLGEPFPTLRASIWLVTGVASLVHRERIFASKTIAAL